MVHAVARVEAAHREEQQAEDDAGQVRQNHGLVEHELGLGPVLASERLGDERGRADAHGLGEREHDEHQVAGEADAGDRLLAEPPDEVEVGKEVEGLEDHREGDERRQIHDVAADRALGEVFHAPESWSADGGLGVRPVHRPGAVSAASAPPEPSLPCRST